MLELEIREYEEPSITSIHHFLSHKYFSMVTILYFKNILIVSKYFFKEINSINKEPKPCKISFDYNKFTINTILFTFLYYKTFHVYRLWLTWNKIGCVVKQRLRVYFYRVNLYICIFGFWVLGYSFDNLYITFCKVWV